MQILEEAKAVHGEGELHQRWGRTALKLGAQLQVWSSWGRKTAVGCRQVLGKKIAGCLETSGMVKDLPP